MQKRIALVGGGNMGGALVAGLVKGGMNPTFIDVLERNPQKCDHLAKAYGVTTHETTGEWLKNSDVIVLAVKPQGMAQTIADIKADFKSEALFISIAAGLRVDDLTRWVGSERLVRAMPNTPALVGAGVVGLYVPEALSEDDRQTACTVVGAMGEIMAVTNEKQLDVLSTVSGSGPAYVFRFIEALEAAAVVRGFDEALARRMAIMTVVGAGKLASTSDEPPAKLRQNVTSKGGTTAEALRIMEEHDFMGMMDEAIQAAYDRNQVLADELGKN